jgi:hypothetical protein
MAVSNRLAREGKLYILTSGTVTINSASSVTEASAVWTQIEHPKNVQPQRAKTTAPTTSYDDAGNASHVVTERALTVALTYNYRGDTSDGSRPTGQAAIEAIADEYGDSAVGYFKYKPFTNADVYIFAGTVDLNGPGGDVNAIGEISMTVEATGIVFSGNEP